MIRKSCIFFIMIVLLVVNTGCWNSRELDDLAIAVGVGVDKVDDQYELSIQIVNPGQIAPQKGEGNQSPVVLYSTKAKTIFEAARKLTQISPRKIYFSQMQVLIFGEQLTREGIAPALDFISRDHEFEANFYIATTKGITAKKALDVMTPLEQNPSSHLYSSLQSSQRAWAPTRATILDELLRDLISSGIEPTLTALEVKDDQNLEGGSDKNVKQINPSVEIKYDNLAVFRKEKLVGYLNEKESKGLNYILGNIKSTIISIPCPREPERKAAMEVIRAKSDMKGTVHNQQPEITIDLMIEQNVGEMQCDKTMLEDPKTMMQFNKTTEKVITQTVQQTIDAAQKKYKSDILGFGSVINRADPQYWKSVKKSWPKKFVKVPVRIRTKVNTLRVGTVNDSLLNKIKE